MLAQGYVGALVMHGLVLGIAYLVIWKWLAARLVTARIQPKSRVKAQQIRREIFNAFLVFLMGTLFSGLIFIMKANGLTRIYTDPAAYGGWPWIAASVVLLILIDDCWFYWLHRLLHTPRLYRWIHNEHHKSIDVTPFTSVSFSMLEAGLLTLWMIPVSLVIPVYAPMFAILQVYGLLENLKAHLGYELFPAWFNRGLFRLFTTSTYHNQHHAKFNGNYGLHLRFWDRVMGTEFPEYDADYAAIVSRRRGVQMPEGAAPAEQGMPHARRT